MEVVKFITWLMVQLGARLKIEIGCTIGNLTNKRVS